MKPQAFNHTSTMNRITSFLLLLTIVTANCSIVNRTRNSAFTKPSYNKAIYQASIQDATKRHICNGVIVNKNFILTLAQCVRNVSANELCVFYGSDRLNDNGMYVNVKEIYIDPGFNQTIIQRDMALISTINAIDFIENVSGSINLPEHDVPVNQVLTTSGWKMHANDTDRIQYCGVNIITLAECKALNPSLDHILRPWLICSVEPINRINNCAGILGSALVGNNSTLYGIMTMNEETAVNTSLNIYANIFDQLVWIRFIIYGWP